MTPKDKAIELVDNFRLNVLDYEGCGINEHKAKQCALIAVDLRLDGDFIFTSIEYSEDSLEYWQEVKQEIEKL